MTNVYDVLAAVAERELELARAGRWDDLRRLQQDRERLIGDLPQRPPWSAREALAQAAAAQEATSAVIDEHVRDARAALGVIARGRTAIGRYSPVAARSRVDATG